MTNYIYFVAFFAFFVIFLNLMEVKVTEMIINILNRVLLGVVFIMFANYMFKIAGVDFMVNINQVSVTVSGILGISGVIFLFAFQWILTTAL